VNLSPSQVGTRAEAAVAAALALAGHEVFLPAFGASGRIDLIVLVDGSARRVQCKTAQLHGGCLTFRTCSNTANVPRAYVGEIDDFGVYSPELHQVFLVPNVGLPERRASLRVEQARNNQRAGLRWAREYLVDVPLPMLTPGNPGEGPQTAP
jgi:hypothetical protein